jgi:acetylornithine deacetylase
VSEALPEVLALLERLVACDTQNPPRAAGNGGIFEALRAALGEGFAYTFADLGDGCASLLAVRGAPTLLCNAHVDTVPRDPGWSGDPFALRVTEDRAVGLGACDIKGAAAALVTAARRTAGPAALFFTSDEEAGSSRCVRTYLASHPAFARALIAEPTRCRAVAEHRGIATCSGHFLGEGGHASSPRALADSAVHEAVRWASRALAFAEEAESRRYRTLSGIRFNLGVLQGGTKPNMIAAAADLRFGVRPLPDQRPEDLLDALTALAPHPERVRWTPGFLAPPLAPLEPGLAADLGLPPADPVDFWTEAALFSEAGIPALVYGPGDIAEAHTAGEWVRLSELAEAETAYERLFSSR